MNSKSIIPETVISSIQVNDKEYLSLTDVASSFKGIPTLIEWMNDRITKDFIYSWERFNNPDFNSITFETLQTTTDPNQFFNLLKGWINKTGAVGLKLKKTKDRTEIFAHKDIAFEFGLWLSPEFKIFLLKEYHRLKAEENMEKSLECNLKEILSKIHIKMKDLLGKENFVPKPVTEKQMDYLYENETDILNTAVFGLTTKQWHDSNPGKKGCPKDYCTIEQMIVLTILESMDDQLISLGLSQSERLEFLNKQAIAQMKAIVQKI